MNKNKLKFVMVLLMGINLSAGLCYAAGTNLAWNCLVSCSRGAWPANAVDGDKTGEHWEAVLDPSPCWLEVDLGEIKAISKIHLYMFWRGDGRSYQYYIEVSSDRSAWKEVVNERKNTQPVSADGKIYTFAPTAARFVRLTVTHNTANPAAHVREIEVYEK